MGSPAIEEPFARRPERTTPRFGGEWADSATLTVEADLGELAWQRLDTAIVDLAGLSALEIEHCHLRNVSFANAEGTEVIISESVIEQSDLSQLRLTSVTECFLAGTKLVGADFSGGIARDSEFNDCVLRLANLRMSRLQRIAFMECTMEDLDAYSAELEDVTFHGSALSGFSVDRVAATRVDLRACTTLGLTGIGRLDGFLASEDQLFALAPLLGDAVGLMIEVRA